MKAVLMSIQPKWCELIANGSKTMEVRKTKPKIETPFKVYIYCTKDNFKSIFQQKPYLTHNGMNVCNGKVIGEFVCDEIYADTDYNAKTSVLLDNACLTLMDIAQYIKPKQIVYFWHISNLVIYDEPKELSEFEYAEAKFKRKPTVSEYVTVYTEQPVKAPQSWCYVEQLHGKE